MTMQGQIPVEFGMVFPHGAYAAGGIEMVRDFDRSSGDRTWSLALIFEDIVIPPWLYSQEARTPLNT